MKIEFIEPTEMLVSNKEEGEGGYYERTVFGFINGMPLTIQADGNYVTYKRHSEIKTVKIVPLGSTDEIPNWCFCLWVGGIDSDFRKRLLQVHDNCLYLSNEPVDDVGQGEKITLEEACDMRLFCCRSDNEFNFWNEIEE